ncbi:MAG: ABC transporter ATP-binding protein [Selenomonadaceae bacterium]|nr:ABC transporter ATP-binding protein [Selenomonadaceae bacterium]
MIKFALKYLRGYRLEFLMIIFCAAMTAAADLATPYLTAKFIDEILVTRNVERLYFFVFGLLAINIFAVASNWFFVVRSTIIRVKLTKNLSEDLMRRVQRLPIKFLLKKDMIYLSKRIEKDSDDLLSFVLGSAIDISIQCAMLAAAIFLLQSIGIKWIILLAIVAAIHAGIFSALRKKLFQYSMAVRESESKFFTAFSDNFLYVCSIKLHSLYEKFLADFRNTFDNFFDASIKEIKLRFWFAYGRANETKIFTVTIFFLGGVDVLEGNLTVGNFVALTGYYSFAMQSVAYFMSLGQSWQNAFSAYERILEIENVPLEINGNKILTQIDKVDVKNIFYEVDGRKIFENFSCKFERGKIYCIVGKNGSGKTTLLNLICGILQPIDGEIKINDLPLIEIDMIHARKNLIAVAEQKEFLKNDTLSGGERRGVSLEKSFSKNADLIILDEPDNNLDDVALKNLLEKILADKHSRITILISHDERIIAVADEIFNSNIFSSAPD